MRQNIFVLGLLDWQETELETIADAEKLNFHRLLTFIESACALTVLRNAFRRATGCDFPFPAHISR